MPKEILQITSLALLLAQSTSCYAMLASMSVTLQRGPYQFEDPAFIVRIRIHWLRHLEVTPTSNSD